MVKIADQQNADKSWTALRETKLQFAIHKSRNQGHYQRTVPWKAKEKEKFIFQVVVSERTFQAVLDCYFLGFVGIDSAK